jgi:hypothetical protein
VKAPLPVSALLATCAVVLSGCTGAHSSSATPFRVRANAICARINTSPFLDTKARYDADLRKTRLGLDQLARLERSAPDKREFRDLVRSMRTIYAFDRAHESAEIALALESKRVDERVMKGLRPRWGKAARRFVALTSREIGSDYDKKFRVARALGLTACNTVGTVTPIREGGSGT